MSSGIPGDGMEENDGSDTVHHQELAGSETKELKTDAFKRLANPRVESILDRIRILGNLSDTSRYEYTQEQVDKIERAIKETLDNTLSKFRGKKERDKFSL